MRQEEKRSLKIKQLFTISNLAAQRSIETKKKMELKRPETASVCYSLVNSQAVFQDTSTSDEQKDQENHDKYNIMGSDT